jgi:hypothetical protein
MEERAVPSDAGGYSAPGYVGWHSGRLAAGELIDVPVPTCALELDEVLRHLEIDGEFSDWANAREHLAQARGVWERLEAPLATRLEKHGHLKEAARAATEMGPLLVTLEGAVAACAGDDVAWLARRAIHLAEAIERALE